MFILSRIVLLILPSSFLAGLIRRTFGLFKKSSLWSLIVIKQLDSGLMSILSIMLSNDLLTISFPFSFILFLMFSLAFLYVEVAPWRSGLWCHGVVVITTAQLHSTKPELRFCAGSNPARGVSEIRDGEDL